MDIVFQESLNDFCDDVRENGFRSGLLRLFVEHWIHGLCHNLHPKYIKKQWENRQKYYKLHTIL